MSFLSALKAVVASQSKPLILPSIIPSTLEDDGDDFLKAPTGSVFYEAMPIPEGPGQEQIQRIVDLLPQMSVKTGPWIAGGAARRLLQGQSIEGGDIDFFFKDRASWTLFSGALEGHEVVIKTDRATTYMVHGFKVQLIKRKFYWSGLEEVFKDFDFSACQIATDGHQLYSTKQAHLDITDMALRFAPGGTIAKHTVMQRMTKYVNYGFLPEPGLFELMVKSGMDYQSAYSIFEGNEVAIYDENEGAVVEETIPTESMDAGVMRTIARQLGLEINNV